LAVRRHPRKLLVYSGKKTNTSAKKTNMPLTDAKLRSIKPKSAQYKVSDADTSAFTHRSLIVISNKRGEVWMPQRLSQKTKLALNTLDADHRRDFYPRFRAIAGLPDEWLARRAEPPLNTEVFRLFIESLNKDDQKL
jgi:hypothetical protein